MRIRTQLFLGTALLLSGMMAGQWYLQKRQIAALEQALVSVATSVGEGLVLGRALMPIGESTEGGARKPDQVRQWRLQPEDGECGEDQEDDPSLPCEKNQWKRVFRYVEGLDSKQKGAREGASSLDSDAVPSKQAGSMRTLVKREVFVRTLQTDDGHGEDDPDGDDDDDDPVGSKATRASLQFLAEGLEAKLEDGLPLVSDDDALTIEFRVEDEHHTRRLVITGVPGGDLDVPIPRGAPQEIVQATIEEGLMLSGLLLLLGLIASAIFAHRVTGPLRQLSLRAEAIGRGALGAQVHETARGEVGELLTAFNQMSCRLQALEKERVRWQARAHLVQLGELSRGLAHTLRNPLNTLGLAVDELGARNSGGEALVATARGQIKRIDNWLRSFLAVGAGRGVQPEPQELVAILEEVILEMVQQGASIDTDFPDDAPLVPSVRPALRSALANLVGNAVEASPEGVPVHIAIRTEVQAVRIEISDQGEGLPEAVRAQLFSPHVTQKAGGSGMGLFLAQQLIEGLHSGSLELQERPGGGTIAVVRLPLRVDGVGLGDEVAVEGRADLDAEGGSNEGVWAGNRRGEDDG